MTRHIRFLGLDLSTGTLEDAVAWLQQRPTDAPFDYIVTPNADHFVRLSRTAALRSVYDGAWLRLLDSRVVARIAWLLGLRPPRVVTGADLTETILRDHLRPGESIAVVGLRPELLPVLVRRYRLSRPAHCDPPFGFEHDPDALEAVVRFVVEHPARFVFLALGSPKQEILAAAIKATNRAVGIGFCIGASLDFLTGAQTRAPRWVQLAGLEWLHRLLSEPRRLARRYLLEAPRIIGLLLRERRAPPA
jgi:exopolysaccharide biosynthesis WecB/TagA/CpsF family protein